MLQTQAAGPFNPFPIFKSDRRGNHHNTKLLRKSSMLFNVQFAHLNFRMPVRNGIQRRLLHAARLVPIRIKGYQDRFFTLQHFRPKLSGVTTTMFSFTCSIRKSSFYIACFPIPFQVPAGKKTPLNQSGRQSRISVKPEPAPTCLPFRQPAAQKYHPAS